MSTVRVMGDLSHEQMRQRARELYAQGLSYAEVGKELGITRQSARQRIHPRQEERERSRQRRELAAQLHVVPDPPEQARAIEPSPYSLMRPEREYGKPLLTVPVKPLTDWLERRLAEWGDYKTLAEAAGVDLRALMRLSNQNRVSLRIADEIMVALGDHPGSIYDEYWQMAA